MLCILKGACVSKLREDIGDVRNVLVGPLRGRDGYETNIYGMLKDLTKAIISRTHGRKRSVRSPSESLEGPLDKRQRQEAESEASATIDSAAEDAVGIQVSEAAGGVVIPQDSEGSEKALPGTVLPEPLPSEPERPVPQLLDAGLPNPQFPALSGPPFPAPLLSGTVLPRPLSAGGPSSTPGSPARSPALALLRALGAPSASGSASTIPASVAPPSVVRSPVSGPADDSRIRIINIGEAPKKGAKIPEEFKNCEAIKGQWMDLIKMHDRRKPTKGDRRAMSVAANNEGPAECFISMHKPCRYPGREALKGTPLEERLRERRRLWVNPQEECPECAWRRANPNNNDVEPDCFIFTDLSTVKIFPPAVVEQD